MYINLVKKYKVKEVFIGKSPVIGMTKYSGGYGKYFDGNTILLELKNNNFIYIENDIDMDRWNIASANYYPHDFLKHLFNLVNEIDPDAYIVNKYQDETYDPTGVVVYKKDSDGEPMWYEVEQEFEDPTNDMDWDDDGYDEAREDFIYSIENFHDEQEEYCIKMIDDGDGRTFDE